jgi:hypothetical protein
LGTVKVGSSNLFTNESNTLATPNYGYEKRQRELAKKKKKEEKLRSKTDRKDSPLAPMTETDQADNPAPVAPTVEPDAAAQ